jgi:hypothetical protein
MTERCHDPFPLDLKAQPGLGLLATLVPFHDGERHVLSFCQGLETDALQRPLAAAKKSPQDLLLFLGLLEKRGRS